jgi:ribosome-associated toxin RatA of RatAB toxin-antitoxin module
MAAVKKLVLVEFPAPRMFELVDRVEEYPVFLPWCGGTELIERTPTRTAARLHVNYHGIRASFSTENDKNYPHHMLIRLRDGPFTHLEGTWDFKSLGDAACKIEFSMHYEFSARVLEKALGPVFHHIANTFVDSFVKRAGHLYPSPAQGES